MSSLGRRDAAGFRTRCIFSEIDQAMFKEQRRRRATLAEEIKERLRAEGRLKE